MGNVGSSVSVALNILEIKDGVMEGCSLDRNVCFDQEKESVSTFSFLSCI